MHFSFELNSILIFLLLIVNQLTYAKPNATPEKPNEESIVPEDMPEEDLSELNDNESGQVLDTGTSKLSPSALSEYMKEHPEVKQITTGGKGTKTKRVYNKFGDVVTITVPDPSSEQKPKTDSKETKNSQISQSMPPYPYPYYNPYQYYAFGQPGQPMMAVNDPRFMPPEGGKPITQEEMAQYQLRLSNANNGSLTPYPPGMPPMMPYPPYPPFNPLFGPNQYIIDGKNVQIMPMPYPNGVGMDPNLRKQLESGRAQLDVANAQIVPIDTETTTEKSETPGTESETLDDRPELPEVIFPKVVTTKKPKHRRHPKRKHKHELKKPHFLMRARLNNLPKKNQNGTDQWWTKPVPKYCSDSIVEIVNCKHKKLEKRWSFNKEDEKCYLYEDLCHSVKKNTFKSLKECMTTCWRPK